MAFMPSANGAGHVDSSAAPATRSVSPRQPVSPKNVAFELLFPEPQYRARLPMRVQIYPHDTTDSIVTTVKNFYGLYSSPTSSKGVSFEDQHSNTLIARYENFSNNMVVYVRVTEQSCPPPAAPEDASYGAAVANPGAAEPHYAPENYPLQAPPRFAPEMSRPTSLTSRWRSPSPIAARGRRSTSANTNSNNPSKKGRSRSSRNRDANSQADLYSDSINGYSSGDNASSSTSGRMKEQIGNTEISLENIVEGGRRKRAKFESSELPLFAPPQMPAATSNPSVSPARRTEHHRPSLPFAHPGQNPFTNPIPLQSPQSHSDRYGQNPYYATPAPDNRRSRGSIGYASQSGNMSGILPTPDPTVGSCMSEEDKDVAIQLMRLGDMSNISHGRTSASTLDDTFSGRADAASSTGATSDGDSESEEDIPEARRQKLDASGAMRKIFHPTQSHFVPRESAEASGDDADSEDGTGSAAHIASKLKAPKAKPALPEFTKPAAASTGPKTNKAAKTQKAPRPPAVKTKKTPVPLPTSSGPMSPSSLPPSRKQSVASVATLPPPWGDPEQVDLSAKPRCQRCRKSKKGCDRQRPCGRCRDAGMSADQCISEDEGNGRKGRYGRHMGVPISKEDVANPVQPPLLPAAPISMAAPPIDKNKKRKR